MRATAILICAATIAASGCGSSSTPAASPVTDTSPSSSSSAALPTAASTDSSPPTTPAAPSPAKKKHLAGSHPQSPGPKLTGYGATTAQWDAAHTAVPGFAPDAVYDADPSLPQVNGHEGTRYYAVLHESGRVLQYDMAFANLPISRVVSQIMSSEFPSDAHKLWFAVKDSCAQMVVQSATLAKALGTTEIGDAAGTVLVEFSSGAADTSYDPGSVNDATFMLAGYTTQSSATAC